MTGEAGSMNIYQKYLYPVAGMTCGRHMYTFGLAQGGQ